MSSSGSSSTFRIERRAPPGDRALAGAGVLAALALAGSGVPAAVAVVAWLLAALACLIERRRRGRGPAAIELQPPSTLRIGWPDDGGGERHDEVELRRWRRLGPLLLLDYGRPARQLAHWLPGMSLNDRRRLQRQLARMRPAAGDSV